MPKISEKLLGQIHQRAQTPKTLRTHPATDYALLFSYTHSRLGEDIRERRDMRMAVLDLRDELRGLCDLLGVR